MNESIWNEYDNEYVYMNAEQSSALYTAESMRAHVDWLHDLLLLWKCQNTLFKKLLKHDWQEHDLEQMLEYKCMLKCQ